MIRYIALLLFMVSCRQGGMLIVEEVHNTDQHCAVHQEGVTTRIDCPNESITIEEKLDIADIFDPCGDDPNYPDEVILILGDGTALAVYAGGSKIFLTELFWDETYQTTDKQECIFTLEDDYEVINSI